ncbi:hypothetical protein GF312_07055 [Candidatus Poribacteria bacterium]|nr:hypothetical protein [Candidatus Poribacteria bacterium]
MPVRKVKILEFAPTADEIWSLNRNTRDGYTEYNPEKGLICFMDTGHEAKQRPKIITTYAGGKATNVARVMDRLIPDDFQIEVELITFLPPAPHGPLEESQNWFAGKIEIKPSTPAGIYVQCLQTNALNKVKPQFEIVEELRETGQMQTTRRCIEMMLEGGGTSLNFSPRMIWSQEAAESVKNKVAEVSRNTDMIVMAGAPPFWEFEDNAIKPYTFYAEILKILSPDCQVSLDTRGNYLYSCLKGTKTPRFMFMNTDEFMDLKEKWDSLYRDSFHGTLIIHNEKGCWLWNGKMPERIGDFTRGEYFPSMEVSEIYSTIGAGDAMHAGFLKEWVFGNNDNSISKSAVYSQVVAGTSISNPKATHGIQLEIVDKYFTDFWNEILNSKEYK